MYLETPIRATMSQLPLEGYIMHRLYMKLTAQNKLLKCTPQTLIGVYLFKGSSKCGIGDSLCYLWLVESEWLSNERQVKKERSHCGGANGLCNLICGLLNV